MKLYTYILGVNYSKRDISIPYTCNEYPSVITTDKDTIFAEDIQTKGNLFIFGSGHVAECLYKQADLIDINCTIIDDREELLTKKRFNNAELITTSNFKETAKIINISKNDFVVVMTRGHKSDFEILLTLLKRNINFKYLGVIGSKNKKITLINYLKENKIDDEKMQTIHSPIGLFKNTETPSEIALSIVAEIFQNLDYKGKTIIEKKMIDTLKNTAEGIECIIIKKSGSSPRGVGTRMVVTKDNVFGTIGGGLVEWTVINDAREILYNKNKNKEYIKTYNLNEKTLGLDMVCGGTISVAFVNINSNSFLKFS